MADRTLVFSAVGVLAGFAVGYLIGNGGWPGNNVTALVAEVRHQNRTLDALLSEQQSALAASLAECRGVQLNLETSLEGCLFERVERQRATAQDPSAETVERQLSGTDPYIETIEYPSVPADVDGSGREKGR